MKIQFESQVHSQRLVLGLLCGLLPICCILFGLFGADEALLGKSWWYSISATYYSNSQVWMIGSLVLASFFLLTYKGYDMGDRVLTLIGSASALGIVIFPTYNSVYDRCGLFMLPTRLSSTLHNISAAALFISFAVMILTQFTKGQDKKRNIVYYICGSIIVLAIISQLITGTLGIGWMTIVNEFFMLEAFAVAWVVKSRALRKKSTQNEVIIWR